MYLVIYLKASIFFFLGGGGVGWVGREGTRFACVCTQGGQMFPTSIRPACTPSEALALYSCGKIKTNSWFATNPRRSKRQWCGSHVGWQNVLFCHPTWPPCHCLFGSPGIGCKPRILKKGENTRFVTSKVSNTCARLSCTFCAPQVRACSAATSFR